jgi:hypothetical protein
MNPPTRSAIEAGLGLCVSWTHYDLVPEHFLLKLLDETGTDFDLIIRHFSLDRASLNRQLATALDKLRRGNTSPPSLSPSLVRMLTESWVIASINYDEASIRTGHTILALLTDPQLSAPLRSNVPALYSVDANELAANHSEITANSVESVRRIPTHGAIAERTSSTRFFISYRRRDSGHSAGRIRDHLVAAFGRDRVFMDVSDLSPGELYAVLLIDAIARCDAVIAVIGKHWNRSVRGAACRKLDDPEDWVRIELATAIEKGKRIIPCLVDGAAPPRVEDLPLALADVARRQVIEVSQHQFERDIAGLVDLLRKITPPLPESPSAA